MKIPPIHRGIAASLYLHYLLGMRRFFLIPALLAISLPLWAQAADSAALLERWRRLRDTDMPAIAFSDGLSFLTDHPNWPDEKIIRLRTEAAALAERPDAASLQTFCDKFPPISGRGMFACMKAPGDAETRKDWVHKGWIQGDFAEYEERAILNEYGKQLSGDHTARMERLLYEQKATAAKRMLDLVPADKRSLYKTRIALIQGDKKSKAMVQGLSAADRASPGIRFDRAQMALSDKKFDQLVALVKDVPASAPYPELWWPLRNVAIRELLASRDYNDALAILAKRGSLEGEALAEALWLHGWITLEFKHDSANGYKEFHSLYTSVNTPVSKARAAYWAGLAAKRNGNTDIAREWWEKAAKHTTVFYGQLAHTLLKPDTALPLPPRVEFTAAQKASFNKEEVVGATRLIATQGDRKLCEKFLAHLVTSTTEPSRMALVADLANELGGTSSMVKIAKLALRKQVILLEAGWPQIPLPEVLGVEPALALAITRQESEFNPQARSGSDARGLMQLLPSTARHVAKRHDWNYADDLLESPNDNITLGSTYLGQIIDGFGGSYILGIASYNGGPGSVRKWLSTMGPLPKNKDAAINWLESIPYGETRNYVMRVLENLQVYRALNAQDKPLQLPQDLVR